MPGKGPSALVIEYNLPEDGHASIELYDAFDERVGVLARGWTSRGVHVAEWSTPRTPAGVYCCRLIANGVTLTRAVLL
jgi:hypothetical protein